MVQGWAGCHYRFDAFQIIAINRLFQLSYFFEGIDMGLELWPTGKAIKTGNFELRFREGIHSTGFEKVFGLVLQMPEIRTVGKRAGKFCGIGRHSDLLSSKPPVVRISG